MTFFNLNNLNFSYFNELANNARQQSVKILENSSSYFPFNASPMQQIVLGAVSGITVLTMIHLFKRMNFKSDTDLKDQTNGPKTHFVSNPDAARLILTGHRCDPNSEKNLFADSHHDFAFRCETRKRSLELRKFLIAHLNTAIRNNKETIVEKTQEWAQSTTNDTSHFTLRNKLHLLVFGLFWDTFFGNIDLDELFQKGNYGDLNNMELFDEAAVRYDISQETIQKMLPQIKDASAVLFDLVSSIYTNLSSDPELQETIFEELEGLKNEGCSLVEAADQSSSIYDLTVESLRTFRGIAPVQRRNARQAFVIKNPSGKVKQIQVNPGDSVKVDLDVLRYYPEAGGPKLEFDKNRHYSRKGGLRGQNFLPFGFGPHICPAAETIRKFCALIIAAIVDKVEFANQDLFNVKISVRG